MPSIREQMYPLLSLDEKVSRARAPTKDEVAELRQAVRKIVSSKDVSVKMGKGSLSGRVQIMPRGLSKFEGGKEAAMKVGRYLLANGWVVFPRGTDEEIKKIMARAKKSQYDSFPGFTLLMKSG